MSRALTILLLSATGFLLSACGGGGGGGDGTENPLKPGLFSGRDDEGDGSFTPTQPTGCSADSSEPNDSRGAARAVSLGDSLSLNFCDDPRDYFSLSIGGGVRVVISTSALAARTDTVLRLLDSAGNELVANDDFGDSLASRVEYTAPGGGANLVIEVSPFDDSITGEDTGYALSISGGNSSGLPDFTFGSSFIASPDNERSFEFEILVENQGEGAGSADVGFYLSTDRDISNTDTLVDFVTTGVIAPGESETVSGVVQWPPDLNGEYIYGLLVDDLGQVTESDESNNDTRFAPVFLGQNAQTCIDDFGEQDDVQTDAIFVLPPTDPFRRHCTDSEDWFEFDATAGSVYTFSTTRLGAASDTLIEIVDGNGSVVARSDDAIGRASSLAITAPRTEVLFVRATQFSGARGRERDYYLNIRQDDLRPDLLTWVDAPDVSLQAGSQVTFDMTVSNIGLGNAPASRIGLAAFASELGSLNRDAPAFFDLADLNIPPLNAGESITLQTSVTIPDYSGDVIFTSAADGDGVIDEAVDSGDGPNYNQGNFLRRTIVGGSGKAVEVKEKGPEQPPILESQP